MAYDHLAKLDVEGLQGYFSDFHKDFYGTRPRWGTPAQWNDRAWLENNIINIHCAMDRMKLTVEGREELRANGWVIDEPEPEIIDPLEYAAWSDYLDAQAYGELSQ